MKPIKLMISRKTKVPTKNQYRHLYRSDWKKLDMIQYEESLRMFQSIKNDAQFCYWLLQKFGQGIYSIIAWKKGKKGFWGFMKVELKEDRFRRLPKNPTKEEIELKNELKDRKEKKAMGDYEGAEISDFMIEDIKKDIKKTKRGCSPYLKSKQPMYSWHGYEEFGEENNEDEMEVKLF